MLLFDRLPWFATTEFPVLCEAFFLPGAFRTHLQTKTIFNVSRNFRKPYRSVSTSSIHSSDDSDDEFSSDGNEGTISNRREKIRNRRDLKKEEESNDQPSRNSYNPSRRDFVVMNSIFAGLVTAAADSVPGTSAAELLFGKKSSEATNFATESSDDLLSMDAALMTEPFSTVRKYKSLTLSNGMRVLLVNDKYARQSSAALTIKGAGQFSDPIYLAGMAHLMEHMVLSSRPGTSWSNQGDFEEWLEEDSSDGFSNGFTAYEKVCFHFQCQTDVFSEGLKRFSNLFIAKNVGKNCRNREAVRREVRRVNSELDKNDLFSREKYLIKSVINQSHPYSRMSLGSIESLETFPESANINVSEELYDFFLEHYQPEQAILVVVSSEPFYSLENMVQSFSATMSNRSNNQGSSSGSEEVKNQQRTQYKLPKRVFPPFLNPGKPIRPICLYRGKLSEKVLANNLEKISFQWALDQDYSRLLEKTNFLDSSNSVVTATQIGFVMAEILGRRGPGSLFSVLQKRKWLPEGNRGVPRVSFPVDVSGFQIMRVEMILTLEGFSKRSSVIAAVFDFMSCLRTNPISRELISQYCSVAKLYGHILAPRPPDAIELAFDGQIYGIDGAKGVATPVWRLLPLPEDMNGIISLQKTMQAVVTKISDPSNAITIITATQRSIFSQKLNDLEEPFPFLSPASWNISPVTGARYLTQNTILTGKINEWMIARIMEEKLSPPVLNPLIPPTLRPPRIAAPDFPRNILLGSTSTSNSNSIINKDEHNPQIFASLESDGFDAFEQNQPSVVRDYWALLRTYSHNDRLPPPGISIPPMPPEPSSRSVFVIQLLSTRPSRSTAENAAHAEVWRISLEYALADLSELGAPGGLAYEISYNNFGMRVSFLGLSQNIASYARRFARRMIDHTSQLLEGPEEVSSQCVDAAIRNTNFFRIPPSRKQQIVGALKQTTAPDAAREGTAFFRSCSGAVCFSQGDLLPTESLSLLAELKEIFRKTTGTNVYPAPPVPEVADLMYRANWVPRAASVCAIPGAALVSNPCGRVPR